MNVFIIIHFITHLSVCVSLFVAPCGVNRSGHRGVQDMRLELKGMIGYTKPFLFYSFLRVKRVPIFRSRVVLMPILCRVIRKMLTANTLHPRLYETFLFYSFPRIKSSNLLKYVFFLMLILCRVIRKNAHC